MNLKLSLKLSFLLVVCIASIVSCSKPSKHENNADGVQKEVKLGTADVEVVCHGDVPEGLIAIVGVSSIFDRTFESEEIQLKPTGSNCFAGQIEIETPQAIAALMLLDKNNENGDKAAVGYIQLDQSKPLTIDVTFEGGKVTNSTFSNTDGVNANPLITSESDPNTMLTDAAYYIASVDSRIIPDLPRLTADDFANQGFKKGNIAPNQTDESTFSIIPTTRATAILDSLRDVIMADAIQGREIPATLGKWFTTHLNEMVYGNYYLGYRESFNTGDNVLPLEFFRFLNDIDFSQLLTHGIVAGPNYILRKMLDSPDLGLSPIGETPVAQWQAEAKESLARVMDNVPQLLLDMLSATSYVQQINDNRPLSATQIANIEAGYSDDLGKLVLKRNARLVSDLEKQTKMSDLSDADFVLQEYIDANYPGKPVVVDTWNTWCMPCMEAHKRVEPLRELPESEGVVFLYVSDVSTPMAEWQRHAPRIGGEHVRISEASRDDMGKTYQLQAFPSYLFFDADHKLHKIETGYPGDDGYMKLVKAINPQK